MVVKPRAPFRYWGAKVRMAPWVIERLPAHDHFVEGCAGSAAIMAVKPPVACETLNDTYGEVVNFWRHRPWRTTSRAGLAQPPSAS